MRGETLTADRLRELLHYEPETGVFARLVTAGNARVGDVAGSLTAKRYVYIRVDGCRHMAQRWAWLHFKGVWPALQIDHINRVRDDNRGSNLRLADDSQQRANADRRADNVSGLKGVSWYDPSRKYRTYIDTPSLGYFDSARDAAATYDVAATIICGEFACLNFPEAFPRSVLLSDRRMTARAWRNIAEAQQRSIEPFEEAA